MKPGTLSQLIAHRAALDNALSSIMGLLAEPLDETEAPLLQATDQAVQFHLRKAGRALRDFEAAALAAGRPS